MNEFKEVENKKAGFIARRAMWLLPLALLFTAPYCYAGDTGVTAGAYSNFSFSGNQPIKNQTFRMQILQDAGAAANAFWSNNLLKTGSDVDGLYLGYQSNGPNQRRTFIYSVWDTEEYRPGSANSYCLIFTGEGRGVSCRMRHEVKEGHIYRLSLTMGEGNWTTAKVVDETTGEEFTLGTIKLKNDHLSREVSKWVEYFEWNDPKSNCFDQPYSKVKHFTPTGNNGTLVATLKENRPTDNICKGMVRIDTVTDGTIQMLNVGNSVKEAITGLDNKIMTAEQGLREGSPITLRTDVHTFMSIAAPDAACLDVKNASQAAGTITQLSNCNGGSAQLWTQQDQQLKSQLSGLCLTQSGKSVLSQPCSQSSLQKWQVNGSGLKNIASGQCLSLKNRSLERLTPAEMSDCDNNPTQQWAMLDGAYSNRWTIGADKTIRTRSGFCIAQGTSVSTNGDAPLILTACSGKTDQQWFISNGEVKNQASGKCIDDPDFVTTEGTALVLHTCNGSSAQRWDLPVQP